MTPQNKMLIKLWSAVIVVFILGCITGAAINSIYSASAKDANAVNVRDTNAYFETLKREVHLTPEQEQKMSTILDQMRNNYKSVCADVKPRYYNVREEARIKMRALLTPEQQESFDKIVTQDDCKCPETPK
jgi:Spy/CpxP family protein refolding chaperone